MRVDDSSRPAQDGRFAVDEAARTPLLRVRRISFDSDGILTVDFQARGDFGQDVALDSSGKSVAAGYTANGGDTKFALTRINP